MNYELAKELKEAGFPQEGKGEILLGWPTPTTNEYTRSTPIRKEPLDEVYVPTLEELIEACGNSFCTLGRPRIDSNKWTAYAYVIPHKDCIASTPEEAVAKLFIALQTNKKQ